HIFSQRYYQRDLGREVEIEGSLRDSGTGNDVGDLRRLQSLRCQHFTCRLQDRRPAVQLAADLCRHEESPISRRHDSGFLLSYTIPTILTRTVPARSGVSPKSFPFLQASFLMLLAEDLAERVGDLPQGGISLYRVQNTG